MSLTEFQRAFSDLIASPRLVLRTRADPGALAAYTLTPREAHRLTRMCESPAMEINCTLYRVNRITPIYSVLPRTCHLLGPALEPELTAFWAAEQGSTLQFHRQSLRFAEWLRARQSSGALAGGPWEDALRLELAIFEARTAPREPSRASPTDTRKRWVELRHDPVQLMGEDLAGAPPTALSEPVWLCVDATTADIEVYVTSPPASGEEALLAAE